MRNTDDVRRSMSEMWNSHDEDRPSVGDLSWLIEQLVDIVEDQERRLEKAERHLRQIGWKHPYHPPGTGPG